MLHKDQSIYLYSVHIYMCIGKAILSYLYTHRSFVFVVVIVVLFCFSKLKLPTIHNVSDESHNINILVATAQQINLAESIVVGIYVRKENYLLLLFLIISTKKIE